MPLYRLANTGASEVFAVFGGKIPRTPNTNFGDWRDHLSHLLYMGDGAY